MINSYKINYREEYWWKKRLCKVEDRIMDCLELQRGQENLHKNEKKYVNKEIGNVGCKKNITTLLSMIKMYSV